MVQKRIKAYWLLLLVLCYTASAVLSVGEAQARYINAVSWNMLVEPPKNPVSSNCLAGTGEAPVTVLLGELALEATQEVDFWMKANTEDTAGELTWTVDRPEYLTVTMRSGEKTIDQNDKIELKAGVPLELTMILEPTMKASTMNHEEMEIHVVVTWGGTMKGTFQATLPEVTGKNDSTEETNPTEETEPTEETDPTEVTEPSQDETDPTEVTEPSQDETDPTEGTEPSQDETDPTEGTEPSSQDETDPTEETESSTDPTEDTEPAQNETNPTEGTEASSQEETDPTEESEPSQEETQALSLEPASTQETETQDTEETEGTSASENTEATEQTESTGALSDGTEPATEAMELTTETLASAAESQPEDTEDSTESTTEPTETNPVTEPVTEPTETDPVTEPTTEPTETEETEPATDPVTEPTEPVTEPTTEPTEPEETEPVTEPATEPTEPEETEPVTEPTTEPTEPEETEPKEEVSEIQLGTITSFDPRGLLPVKIALTDEVTSIRFGLGTVSEDGKTVTMKPLPAYTRYSLNNGRSYYIAYNNQAAELTARELGTGCILMDFTHAELKTGEGVVLVMEAYAGAVLLDTLTAATAAHAAVQPVLEEGDETIQENTNGPLMMSATTALEFGLPEAWKSYTLEYSVERLTMTEEKKVEYVAVDLNAGALLAEYTKDTTHKLSLQAGETLPRAGTYRINFKWSYEGICYEETQTTFFINYSAHTEKLSSQEVSNDD